MKTNLGPLDRAVRLILAVIVIVLFAANVISGTTAIILLAVATIFLLTSMIGFCPVYAVLGLTSFKTKRNTNPQKT